MKQVHIKEILITKEHLDQMNHVNNVQYVHWVEEMAKEHWDILRHNTNYVDDFWFWQTIISSTRNKCMKVIFLR